METRLDAYFVKGDGTRFEQIMEWCSGMFFPQESKTIKAILFGAELLMSDVLYHQIQGLEKYVLLKLLTFKIEVLTAFFLIIASLVSPHIFIVQ